jgi:hypothetical protein
MGDYLSELVNNARKALNGDKTAALDRKRLKKAKRVGPTRASSRK